MKWQKFTIGLILLPALMAVAWTLARQTDLGWRGQAWHSLWFVALAGGLATWSLAYVALPRPMWIYVFGHELTHALFVYLHGGKVTKFRVSSGGGHVKTNTINWWITLSPYFIPIYSLLWMGLWMGANFFVPLRPWEWGLYAGLGLTWGFHLTFTISMIQLGQSDIRSQGFLFSLVIILIFNLFLIELFLTGVLDHYTVGHWMRTLWDRIVFCYSQTGSGLWQAGKWCWHWCAKLWHNLQLR